MARSLLALPCLYSMFSRLGDQPDFQLGFLAGCPAFLAGGPLVYSLPSVLLQGALRNLGVLAISIYLAVVSS